MQRLQNITSAPCSDPVISILSCSRNGFSNNYVLYRKNNLNAIPRSNSGGDGGGGGGDGDGGGGSSSSSSSSSGRDRLLHINSKQKNGASGNTFCQPHTLVLHLDAYCRQLPLIFWSSQYITVVWLTTPVHSRRRSYIVFQEAVLLTVGRSYVANDVTPSTLLDRACACSYENLPKYRSYRVSNTAPCTAANGY